MSTLAGTTWTVNYSMPNNGNANMTVAFATNGTVAITFQNGSGATGNWAEAEDGHFLFQWPNSTTNPNINEVFFGLHEGGEGQGHHCDITTQLYDFSMKKN
jgi:hypothetical protein